MLKEKPAPRKRSRKAAAPAVDAEFLPGELASPKKARLAIVPFTLEHADAAAAVLASAFAGTSMQTWPAGKLRAFLKRDNTRMFVAIVGGELVGFRMGQVRTTDGGRRYVHTHMVAIAPEVQGQGVGLRMAQVMIEDTRALGIDRVVTNHDFMNVRAAAFLASLGVCSIARGFDRAAPDTVRNELWIDQPAGVFHIDERAPVLNLGLVAAPAKLKQRAVVRAGMEKLFRRGLLVCGFERDVMGGGAYLFATPEGYPLAVD